VGFRCERPHEVRPALQAAFAAQNPAIVEAVVDPFEPPMPATATPEQALHLAESLVRGQPDGGRIIASIIGDDELHSLGKRLRSAPKGLGNSDFQAAIFSICRDS